MQICYLEYRKMLLIQTMSTLKACVRKYATSIDLQRHCMSSYSTNYKKEKRSYRLIADIFLAVELFQRFSYQSMFMVIKHLRLSS